MKRFPSFIYGSFEHSSNGYHLANLSKDLKVDEHSKIIENIFRQIGNYTTGFDSCYFLLQPVNNKDLIIIACFKYFGFDAHGRENPLKAKGIIYQSSSVAEFINDFNLIINKLSSDIDNIDNESQLSVLDSFCMDEQEITNYSTFLKDFIATNEEQFIIIISNLLANNSVIFPNNIEFSSFLLALVLIQNNVINISCTSYCKDTDYIKNYKISSIPNVSDFKFIGDNNPIEFEQEARILIQKCLGTFVEEIIEIESKMQEDCKHNVDIVEIGNIPIATFQKKSFFTKLKEFLSFKRN
jgi:hypothetical protein